MERRTLLAHILAALMVILAAAGSLCGAVETIATDADFYGGMSRTAVTDTLGAADAPDQVTAYIGLTDEEQDAFAAEIVPFMKGETDVQPEILSEKEQQHMLDVRALIHLADRVSQACMTAAAVLAVVIAWLRAGRGRGGMPIGALAGLLIVLALAGGAFVLLNTSGFEALFIRMHELLFTNDLWLLDPATDILIRMMPQLLFERAAEQMVMLAVRSLVITWVMLCVVYMIVGGMIKRHLSEKTTAV